MTNYIEIVQALETVDNDGNTEKHTTHEALYELLTNPYTYTDDTIFFDKNGTMYWIDDLIGHDVLLFGSIITVPNDYTDTN